MFRIASSGPLSRVGRGASAAGHTLPSSGVSGAISGLPPRMRWTVRLSVATTLVGLEKGMKAPPTVGGGAGGAEQGEREHRASPEGGAAVLLRAVGDGHGGS
jgi:hypothetical protein